MSSYWAPRSDDSLQIQFTGDSIAILPDVDIYDLDLFDTTQETIKQIHARDGHVICYINAGAWEDWRPDAGNYPTKVLGRNYTGWPGERWIDIRQMDLLESLLSARLDICKQKGFDGIEPDNLDGYQNETGFDLTAEDQIAFNRWLVQLAHSRGLSIGLKNDPDQMQQLAGDFDFAVMEDCFQYSWCNEALPFIKIGKPAFDIEYTDRTTSLSPYCSLAKELGLSLILKNRELDTFRNSCP